MNGRGLVAGLGLMAATQAWATATDGTLLTNTASATFGSATSPKSFLVSYSATATVQVANPSLALWKLAAPTVQAAGGEVTFQVCVKNTSAMMSAFDVSVTDRLPDNMAYVGGSFAGWPATWTAFSGTGASGPWTGPANPAGQASPYYLRWTRPMVGVGASGCVTYRARVL